MDINKGIIQNGGTINANAMAVGDHASAQSGDQNVRSNDINELSELIETLIGKLKSPELAVKEKEEIAASLETIKGELKKENPNKTTVKGIGKAVLDTLKNVAELAPIAGTIWAKVVTLF